MVTSGYFFFCVHVFFSFLSSFNSTPFYLGWSSKVWSGIYHAIHGCIGKREVFRRSSRIMVNKVTFERFVQCQYTLAKKCFSRSEMYIPPMSNSSLWLLSKALDFWEIHVIILKSAPTLHLIYNVLNLIFYSLRQFFDVYRMTLY